MTAIEILFRWLTPEKVFRTHQIATELPNWGKFEFEKLFAPGTYDRKFRYIRESKLLQHKFGVEIKELERRGREKKFEVIKYNGEN